MYRFTPVVLTIQRIKTIIYIAYSKNCINKFYSYFSRSVFFDHFGQYIYFYIDLNI